MKKPFEEFTRKQELEILAIVRRWGKDKSIDRAIEELNELAVALSHKKRGKCPIEHLQEEIADVTITIKHLQLVFGLPEDLVQFKINKGLSK